MATKTPKRAIFHVEFEVDWSWIEDGFDPKDSDWLDALAHMLPYAFVDAELSARQVKRGTIH